MARRIRTTALDKNSINSSVALVIVFSNFVFSSLCFASISWPLTAHGCVSVSVCASLISSRPLIVRSHFDIGQCAYIYFEPFARTFHFSSFVYFRWHFLGTLMCEPLSHTIFITVHNTYLGFLSHTFFKLLSLASCSDRQKCILKCNQRYFGVRCRVCGIIPDLNRKIKRIREKYRRKLMRGETTSRFFFQPAFYLSFARCWFSSVFQAKPAPQSYYIAFAAAICQ